MFESSITSLQVSYSASLNEVKMPSTNLDAEMRKVGSRTRVNGTDVIEIGRSKKSTRSTLIIYAYACTKLQPVRHVILRNLTFVYG